MAKTQKAKPITSAKKAGRGKPPATAGKHNTTAADRAKAKFLHSVGFKPSEVHIFGGDRFHMTTKDLPPLSEDQQMYVTKTYGSRSLGFVKVFEPKGV